MSDLEFSCDVNLLKTNLCWVIFRFPDNSLKSEHEKKQDLRDQVYNCMVERSKNSDFEYIEYRKK